MSRLPIRAILAALSLASAGTLAGCDGGKGGGLEVTMTVGDLTSSHDDVSVDGKVIAGVVRLEEGRTVSTSPEGRARLVLDRGAVVAIDGKSVVRLEGGALVIQEGRVFVRAGDGDAPLAVAWGKAKADLLGSAVAFDVTKAGATRAYCATGEFTLTGAGGPERVEAGESAVVQGDQVAVLPEKAFEDWTGGLAAPEDEEIEGKSAIPHVRARSGIDDAGVPLVVRSHHVDTKIVGEVAVTRGVTTYFNGSDRSGEAYVRLALPEDAFITGVTVKSEDDAEARPLSVVIAAGPARKPGDPILGLEWAGGGWLQGTLGSVPAGKTLEVSITYAEWLDVKAGRATYRYGLNTDPSVPPVAELALRVDAQETLTSTLAVTEGAKVNGREVVYRAADTRPQGDFVVELLPDVVDAEKARVYVERQAAGGSKDAYVLVRTELPPKARQGVTMAIVVDTSLSVGASTLETSLSVVDSIILGLGPKDSVVVIAADETARPVGPKVPTRVDDALRATLAKELAALRVGGASNLAKGLQAAADLLDAGKEPRGQTMVVYVGDGAPTVGPVEPAAIRDALEARPGGMPRLGAVAVGPLPNRWLLARLTQGAGQVVEAQDRADAARAGAVLLGEALTPRYSDVEVDLGPDVDRVYPRRSQVVTAGETLSVVGRLRGSMPQKAKITYRDGGKLTEMERRLVRLKLPPSGDLSKLWAKARVEQIVSEGEGVEPAIALAQEAGLVTPWTSILAWAPSEGLGTRPFSHKLLELSLEHDVAFAQQLDPFLGQGSSLIEPDSDQKSQSTLVEAAEAAMRRILEAGRRSIRACRDARAAVNPAISDGLIISVSIDGGGRTTRISVVQRNAIRQDDVLNRCIEGVVKTLPYVAVGSAVSVTHDMTISGRRTLRQTKCSEASKVSLPVRREIWRSRLPSRGEHFAQAAEACELKTWSDRQQFLLLTMEGAENDLELARELERMGEQDAAGFVRHQALKAVKTFAELQAMMRELRQDEPAISAELELALGRTRSDAERVEVCRKFLLLAPHDTYARRRLLALFEALGQKERALSALRQWREEPVADAALLAEGAATLLRLGEKDEGRRVFGELIERAPGDPWTLAFVGDRLRGVELYDEAQAAYDSLARIMPQEGAVTLRQALAHAGAGRTDVASRLLERVAQTGGRNNEGRLSDLASIAEAVLLSSARQGTEGDALAELERRLLRTALPDAQALIFVRAAPTEEAVRLEVLRQGGETLAQTADLDASDLGLIAARVERGETAPVRLALRRDKVVGPSHPVEAVVSLLSLGAPGTLPEYSTKTVKVAADGTTVELSVQEGRFL